MTAACAGMCAVEVVLQGVMPLNGAAVILLSQARIMLSQGKQRNQTEST